MHRHILDESGKARIFGSSGVVAGCLNQNADFSAGMNVGPDCTGTRNNIAAEAADLHVFADDGNSLIQHGLDGLAAVTAVRLSKQLLNRCRISLQDMVARCLLQSPGISRFWRRSRFRC